MSNSQRYVPEDEVSIEAIADGELTYWRCDANGVRWYRARSTPPDIHGVGDDDIEAVYAADPDDDPDDDPRSSWLAWFRGLLTGDDSDD